MCRALSVSAVLAFVLLTAACGGGGKEAPTAAEVCAATVEVPDVPANVNSSELIEASGLASSRADDEFLWAHNDSGDSARFFAFDYEGGQHATYSITGVEAIDWEDMAIGPGPDSGVDYLYFADIGDNAMQRPNVTVYRLPEPEVAFQPDTPVGPIIKDAEAITLIYPDGPHDAETLLVDPKTADLLIVTKEVAGGPSSVFVAQGPVLAGGVTQLELVITVDFASLVSSVEVPDDAPQLVQALPNLPTAGDVSPDGKLVIVRTYGSAWVWTHVDDAQPLWTAFAGQPCEAPTVIEQQGEAIAFDPDGRGYTTVS
jgi:hypothetical protein